MIFVSVDLKVYKVLGRNNNNLLDKKKYCNASE